MHAIQDRCAPESISPMFVLVIDLFTICMILLCAVIPVDQSSVSLHVDSLYTVHSHVERSRLLIVNSESVELHAGNENVMADALG